jgi:hypothetical protein
MGNYQDRIAADVAAMRAAATVEEMTALYHVVIGREPDDDAAGSMERMREDIDDYLTTECVARGIHCAAVGLK